jgi:hypothetical protein
MGARELVVGRPARILPMAGRHVMGIGRVLAVSAIAPCAAIRSPLRKIPVESGWPEMPALFGSSSGRGPLPARSLPSPSSSALCLDPPPCFFIHGCDHPSPSMPASNRQAAEAGLLLVPTQSIPACCGLRPRAKRLRFATSAQRCDLIDYVAQSQTPQAHCVRFGRAATGRNRNTRHRAAHNTLPGRGPHCRDRADFARRTAKSVGISNVKVR